MRSFLLLLGFIILPTSLFAQNADEMAKEIENLYRSGAGTSISFTLDGEKTSLSFATSTSQFRVDMANDLIVSDGTTIWHYGKAKKEVAIDKIQGKSGSLSNIEEIIKFSTNYSGVLSHKGNTYELQLTPSSSISKLMESVGNISLLTFTFTKSHSGIQMKKISARSSQRNFAIGNIKIKSLTKLDPKLFTFTTPAGAKVIDLRD